MRFFTSFFILLISIIFANSNGPGGNYANNAPNYNNCTSCHSGNVNSGNGTVSITGLPNGGYVPGETYSLTLSVTGAHARGYGFQMASQVGSDNAGTFSLGASSENAELTGNRVQHSTRTISGEWIVDWLAPDSDVGDVTFSFSGLATGGTSGYGGDNVYTGSIEISASVEDITFQPQTKDELQTAVDLWESDNSTAVATYGEINEWDISLITDISGLFYGLNLFNDDIFAWDVSNVINMANMFSGATSFNIDLSNWNVSNVTDMEAMFYGASSFNQDISAWDVSSVTEMETMFENTESLSAENRCIIHENFSANDSWPYDWVSYCVLSSNEGYAMPKTFGLDQNYPNPFNPTTQIDYKIPENNFVNITIYDVIGHEIKSLVNIEQEAGHRSVHWNATNNFGETVPAGMYIYIIQAGEFRQTKKMVLLK